MTQLISEVFNTLNELKFWEKYLKYFAFFILE